MKNARSGFDLENGNFWIEIDSPSEIETEFRTDNGCEFSIFDDDEEEDIIHIEIDPDYMWSKEDVWELIGELLYRSNQMDENGNLIIPKVEVKVANIGTINARNIKIDEASPNDGFNSAGLFLQVASNGGSRVRIEADEFVLLGVDNALQRFQPNFNLGEEVKFLHRGKFWLGTIDNIHTGGDIDEDQYVIMSNDIRFHKTENQIQKIPNNLYEETIPCNFVTREEFSDTVTNLETEISLLSDELTSTNHNISINLDGLNKPIEEYMTFISENLRKNISELSSLSERSRKYM